jgi:regulator of protease activity HflC (stomatin/prohibitin superfamily)
MSENRNTYLDQVVANQERLEQDLRMKQAPASAPMYAQASTAPPSASRRSSAPAAMPAGNPGSAPATEGTNAVDVRVTGRFRWRTVVVPPNAFVVHTRRGHAEPLHVGLGVSFRFRPATDSYLVVPGAMQTILISAFCICSELQGVLVQAYVQWIIQDFSVAYRKLDFSGDDPMRLVNLQLNEQAQAAIKDKVATMSVGEVLSDKQPIIEELTARLRAVAEGEGGSETGLGLRIVTVQIKEAVVSSSRLWENLQKPYRAEQGRVARLAELAAEEAVSERETAAQQERETRRIDTERELAVLRASAEAQTFDREVAERVRRAEQQEANTQALADLEQATVLHTLGLEHDRMAGEAEVARLRLERDQLLRRLGQDGDLALAAAETDAEHARTLLAIERDRLRAAIDNEQTEASLRSKLIDSLPEIVDKMPTPTELRAVTIGGTDSTSLAGLVAELVSVVAAMRTSPE